MLTSYPSADEIRDRMLRFRSHFRALEPEEVFCRDASLNGSSGHAGRSSDAAGLWGYRLEQPAKIEVPDQVMPVQVPILRAFWAFHFHWVPMM